MAGYHSHVGAPSPPRRGRISTDITRREALRRAAVILGGTLSAPTIAAVLAGCGDRRTAAKPDWTPRTLTPEQRAIVVAIAEAIIPETETPGARAAQVDQFVDNLLSDHMAADDKERFVAGLGRVDARARRMHQKGFAELTSAQQTEIVNELDQLAFREEPLAQAPEGAAPSPRSQESDVQVGQGVGANPAEAASPPPEAADVGGESFFRMMKELAVVGYYTSEVGQTQELRVNPMKPYRDIPYTPGMPTWA